MKEAEKEANKIIEMFHLVDSSNVISDILTMRQAKQCAILHVEGIIEALENNQWQNRKLIEHQQQVKQAIENKKI